MKSNSRAKILPILIAVGFGIIFWLIKASGAPWHIWGICMVFGIPLAFTIIGLAMASETSEF